MKAEVYSALDRLQAALPLNGTSISAFLAAHKADVEVVMRERGSRITAELLGFSVTGFRTYGKRAGLALPSRSEAAILRAKLASATGPQNSADYWRGMATAYHEALELFLDARNLRKDKEETYENPL
jgi:hypothetical protein